MRLDKRTNAWPGGNLGEVWAVDSEPDMVGLVLGKAADAGVGDVRPIVSSAETLHAEPGYFELAVVGG